MFSTLEGIGYLLQLVGAVAALMGVAVAFAPRSGDPTLLIAGGLGAFISGGVITVLVSIARDVRRVADAAERTSPKPDTTNAPLMNVPGKPPVYDPPERQPPAKPTPAPGTLAARARDRGKRGDG